MSSAHISIPSPFIHDVILDGIIDGSLYQGSTKEMATKAIPQFLKTLFNSIESQHERGDFIYHYLKAVTQATHPIALAMNLQFLADMPLIGLLEGQDSCTATHASVQLILHTLNILIIKQWRHVRANLYQTVIRIIEKYLRGNLPWNDVGDILTSIPLKHLSNSTPSWIIMQQWIYSLVSTLPSTSSWLLQSVSYQISSFIASTKEEEEEECYVWERECNRIGLIFSFARDEDREILLKSVHLVLSSFVIQTTLAKEKICCLLFYLLEYSPELGKELDEITERVLGFAEERTNSLFVECDSSTFRRCQRILGVCAKLLANIPIAGLGKDKIYAAKRRLLAQSIDVLIGRSYNNLDQGINEFQNIYAMKVMSYLCKQDIFRKVDDSLDSELLLHVVDALFLSNIARTSSDRSQTMRIDLNAEVAEFLKLKWKMLAFTFPLWKRSIERENKERTTIHAQVKGYVRCCFEFIENGVSSKEIVPSIFWIIQQLLPLLFSTSPDDFNRVLHEESVGRALDLCWRVTQEFLYLPVIKGFVGIAFEPHLIKEMGHAGCKYDVIKVQFDRLLSIGEKIEGVMSFAAGYLSMMQNSNVSSFIEQFTILMTYGPYRRESCKNVVLAANVPFKPPLIVDIPFIEGEKPIVCEDGYVRASAITVLEKIDDGNLIGRLILSLFDESTCIATKPYRFNTPVHKKQVRIWQVLCLLIRREEAIKSLSSDTVKAIEEEMWKIIEHQKNLKSVLSLIQIFAIHFYFFYSHFSASPLLKKLKEDINGKSEVLSSLIVICGHLILLSKEKNSEEKKKLLYGILPFITCNHTLIRASSQTIIYTILKEDDYSDTDVFVHIRHYLETNADCKKSVEKYAPFTLIFKSNNQSVSSIIDITTPYFIYSSLPFFEKLFDEVITTTIWRATSNAIDSSPIQNELPIMLIESNEVKEETKIAPLHDIQRKMIPQWEGLIENDNELVRHSMLANKRRTELIVVASLVDKVPNLAGLARTCEIFNVGTLVIPNSKISKDAMFQSISVTSEKWLPIIEVPEGNALIEFLTSKRDEEGYTLLGLEQTAGSVLLNDYASLSTSFPSKTILLLGKEKEGIPQLYFPLLHQCIEIPQLGIIRSLNVHVSGSIFIWEYTRRHLTPK